MTSTSPGATFIQLPSLAADLDEASANRRSAIRRGLMCASILAVLLIAALWGGALALLVVFGWAWIPLLLLGLAGWDCWVWSRLRQDDQPQSIVITGRSLSLRVGEGRGHTRKRVRVKDLRTLQLGFADPNATTVRLWAIKWDFESLPFSPPLSPDQGENVGHQVVDSINARLRDKRINQDGLITFGTAEESEDRFADELLRPPPGSRSRVVSENGNVSVIVPVRMLGRSVNRGTTWAVSLTMISALGWLICIGAGNWIPQAKLVLMGITVLALLLTARAWHHFAFAYVITAHQCALEVKARRVLKDRTDTLAYEAISDIEVPEKDNTFNLTIEYGPKRKRRILQGHDAEELRWLRVLLRHLTGLD